MSWQHNPIGVYLMSCYAYVMLDSPFLTDYEFDMLGRHIDEHWDSLNHVHKKYIDREGVAYTSAITVDYFELPLIVLTATHELLRTTFKSSPLYGEAMERLKPTTSFL